MTTTAPSKVFCVVPSTLTVDGCLTRIPASVINGDCSRAAEFKRAVHNLRQFRVPSACVAALLADPAKLSGRSREALVAVAAFHAVQEAG